MNDHNTKTTNSSKTTLNNLFVLFVLILHAQVCYSESFCVASYSGVQIEAQYQTFPSTCSFFNKYQSSKSCCLTNDTSNIDSRWLSAQSTLEFPAIDTNCTTYYQESVQEIYATCSNVLQQIMCWGCSQDQSVFSREVSNFFTSSNGSFFLLTSSNEFNQTLSEKQPVDVLWSPAICSDFYFLLQKFCGDAVVRGVPFYQLYNDELGVSGNNMVFVGASDKVDGFFVSDYNCFYRDLPPYHLPSCGSGAPSSSVVLHPNTLLLLSVIIYFCTIYLL
eukprot:TRINITY_DN154_c0_g1_i2.p1 TRINITY_DN154_c0_g1~~TRINITY_DN154_c0_g1_i2.p1  ORF type:complete len:276 (+),score=28.61 TRINITY_DN154_c0_g1_i2:145-972(+)